MGPALLFSQIIKLTNKMLNGKILNEEAERVALLNSQRREAYSTVRLLAGASIMCVV